VVEKITADRKKKSGKKIFIILCLILLVMILTLTQIPYQGIIQKKLKKAIEDHGIKVTSLNIESINNNTATISELELGDKPSLNITRIELAYRLQRLLTSGFDANTGINADATAIIVKSDPYTINADELKADMQGNNGTWKGTVAIPKLDIKDLEQDIPTLTVNSEMKFDREKLNADTVINDKTKEYSAEIISALLFNAPRSGNINIKHMQFPWGGGRIYADNVIISLAFDKPIKIGIHLENVELADTLGKVSDKIKGDGKISGVLPVIYYPDGTITLDDGVAAANSGGIINVSPTLMPGDNAQVAIARTALENFHYTSLKISVSSDKNNKSSINLAIEGKNPDAFGDRPVKLNVNLAGDIIPLIQQSLLPLEDFKKLMDIKETK